MGGLARKSTIINNNKSDGYEVLIADAGNLFFKKDNLSPGVTMETAKATAEIIVSCFNEIGCDVFSPSSQDFAGGYEFLKSLENKSNFPFISANIFSKYGQKIFDPYIIENIKGKKIAFIGLSSKFESEEISVEEPFKILDKVLKDIKSKADMVVLLFNASDKDLNILKSKNYNIDLAIRSRSNLPAKTSNDGGVYNIPIYSLGSRGKYVYDFDIKIDNNSSDFIDLKYVQSKLSKTNNFLKKHNINFNESLDLSTQFKDSPEILKDVQKNLKLKEDLEDILDNKTNYFSFTKHELDSKINDDQNILSIIDKGKELINQLYGPIPDHKGRLPGDPHHGHNH
ncbi:MAG: hypothetical protein CMP16_04045 [Rickettsiales bacterium]|nr:hypothetical protein [Rickettsiales bacterium]